MPTLHLTKTVIDDLRAAPTDTVYWDKRLSGFGVKVTPKGRKVFIVVYRTRDSSRRLRKYTIGPYGQITLAVARITAQKVLAARLEGHDPAAQKLGLHLRTTSDLVEEVVASYRLRHVNTIRSASETIRILDREVLSRWKGRSIHDISRSEVLKMVDEIVQRGSPGMANRTFTVVRALYNWAIGRGILEKSPCSGLSKPTQSKSRDRCLGDQELRNIIQATRTALQPFGSIVQLLALTGQRRAEVTEMQWSEIDLEKSLWLIPSSRAKNGRSHIVHLSPQALEIITTSDASSRLVFPSHLGKAFDAFSHHKRQLDKASGVTNWVLHDLRRTVVSGMSSMGVPPHVADKLLNHQSGSISGVAAVYQRHEFLAERKAAIELWGNHVAQLCR